MGPEVDEVLVADVARVVVEKVAPAELLTFRPVSEAYFADPARSLAGGGGHGRLRIGDAGIVLLLTPIALASATEVTKYLFGEVIRPMVVSSGSAVRRLFGAAHGSAEPDEPPLELTAAQWARVHEIVVDVVLRAGQTTGVAQLMADAVVGAGQRPDQIAPQ